VAFGVILALFVYLVVGHLGTELSFYRSFDPKQNILASVTDGEKDEADKIYNLFYDIVRDYKLKLTRHLVKQRKYLLKTNILSNIIAPAARGEQVQQSVLRSVISKKLVLEEILASTDPTIYEPCLVSMVELIVKHKKFCFDRFYQVIKDSAKLPDCARALISILIRAEHGKISLGGDHAQPSWIFEAVLLATFNDPRRIPELWRQSKVALGSLFRPKTTDTANKEAFFVVLKDIIKRLAQESPLLKKQIIAYLLEHTSRSKEELPLARSLLKDLGFYIVSSRDFAWTAAGLVAGEINRVQKERGLVNAVFTGGRTMSTYISQGELKKGFLRELADPEYCIS
jgi:hypothetical protein